MASSAALRDRRAGPDLIDLAKHLHAKLLRRAVLRFAAVSLQSAMHACIPREGPAIALRESRKDLIMRLYITGFTIVAAVARVKLFFEDGSSLTQTAMVPLACES